MKKNEISILILIVVTSQLIIFMLCMLLGLFPVSGRSANVEGRLSVLETDIKEMNKELDIVSDLSIENNILYMQKDISRMEERISRIEYGIMCNDFIR